MILSKKIRILFILVIVITMNISIIYSQPNENISIEEQNKKIEVLEKEVSNLTSLKIIDTYKQSEQMLLELSTKTIDKLDKIATLMGTIFTVSLGGAAVFSFTEQKKISDLEKKLKDFQENSHEIDKKIDIVKYKYEADTLFNNGDYEGAKKLYSKIINIDNKHIESLSKLSEVYYELDDIRNAIEKLDKCIEINSNDTQLYYQRAKYSLEVQGSDEVYFSEKAKRDCDKILKIKPTNNIELYMNVGELYIEMGLYNLALKCYNEVIAIDSIYSEAYFKRADLYYKYIDDDDNIIKGFNDLIKHYEDDEEMLIKICKKYIKYNLNEEAIEIAKKVEDTVLLSRISKNTFASEEYNLTIEVVDTIEKISGGEDISRLLYIRRGDSYAKLDEDENAIKNYKEALDLTKKEINREKIYEKIRNIENKNRVK